MDDATSLLLGLDSFRVVDVVGSPIAPSGSSSKPLTHKDFCPDCGQPSTSVKDRPPVRIRDLPVAGQSIGCGTTPGRVDQVPRVRPGDAPDRNTSVCPKRDLSSQG
jgi:hypothetical protein